MRRPVAVMAVVLVAVLTLLVTAWPSDSQVAGTRWQGRALAISAGYWQSACRVRIKWRPFPGLILGMSTVGDCLDDGVGTEHLAYLLTSRKWPVRCATVVHEEGHLLGLRHSTNPFNIMYPQITWRNIPAACQR